MGKWLSKKENEFNLALNSRNAKMMRDLFNEVPTVDLAIFANKIEDPTKLTFIFKTVKSELTADFFTELSDETQEQLLNVFSDSDLLTLINDSFADDIVDVLEDLPANLVSRALRICPKEKRVILNKLLNYKEDSAGSIMTTEFIELRNTTKVDDAIKIIRERGKDAETVYTIFLKDDKRNLVGTCDLDDLIFAKADATLDEIKNSEFVYVTVDTDQEEVANKFKKYDLNAIAVVNTEKKLIGIITVDDIMDVIEHEASEDIALQSGVYNMDDDYTSTRAWRMAFRCAPWLLILIVIGVFSEFVLSKFQDKLAILPPLIFFIPVLMDTGGNAGGQTCGLIIRGLALKEFGLKDYPKILWKEVKTAVLTGLMVASIAFGIFMIEFSIPGLINFPAEVPGTISNKLVISGIVSAALFSAILISKVVACSLPFLAVKFKKDPALTSQPFVTTIVDVCSLLIYFGIFILIVNLGYSFI